MPKPDVLTDEELVPTSSDYLKANLWWEALDPVERPLSAKMLHASREAHMRAADARQCIEAKRAQATAGEELQSLLRAGLEPISLPSGKYNIPREVMAYIRTLEAAPQQPSDKGDAQLPPRPRSCQPAGRENGDYMPAEMASDWMDAAEARIRTLTAELEAKE